jgi:hypothetical protein
LSPPPFELFQNQRGKVEVEGRTTRKRSWKADVSVVKRIGELRESAKPDNFEFIRKARKLLTLKIVISKTDCGPFLKHASRVLSFDHRNTMEWLTVGQNMK